MIHVVAIITAKPGKRDEILKNFKANVPAVHAEKGCIEYGATVDTDGGPFAKFGPDTFVVIEKWESMDASQGPRRLGAHEGLRRKEQGSRGQPRRPRPAERLIASASVGASGPTA